MKVRTPDVCAHAHPRSVWKRAFGLVALVPVEDSNSHAWCAYWELGYRAVQLLALPWPVAIDELDAARPLHPSP